MSDEQMQRNNLTDFKVITFDCYGTLIDWVGLLPLLRQTVKTRFAVRCKNLDRQDHFIAF